MVAKLYLSYRDFQNLEVCPQRYYLLNIKRVQVRERKRVFLVGTVLHTLVERWVRARFLPGMMERYAGTFFDMQAKNVTDWLGPDDRETLRARAVEYARKTEEVLRELGFPERGPSPEVWTRAVLPRYPGVEFGGRIDLEVPAEASLWDMKFTTDARYLDPDQLLFYALARGLEKGRRVLKTGEIAPLRSDVCQEFEWEKEHLADMYDRIVRAVEVVRSGEFPELGDDNRDCMWCAAKHACSRWVHEVTVNELPDGRKRAML